MHSPLEQQLRQLIQANGRITFARFMQVCLYSRHGGFYATRRQNIGAHFGTSPTSHPLFGILIARQLEQMWHCLGSPSVFHVIEVGAGDGALARSVVHACRQFHPGLSHALCYIASDYEPYWPEPVGRQAGGNEPPPTQASRSPAIQRVKSAGLGAFRNIVGCILSNELIDNFPAHRFVIRDGRVREIFVTVRDGQLSEVADEPSTAAIEERLDNLGLSLPEGYHGEVNLAMGDWTHEIAGALERGFVLTFDYGNTAAELYAPGNHQGTLVCHHQHLVREDPYSLIGQQDITCHVDFTTLMRLGEKHGLTTVGFDTQRAFLMNLGFASHLETPDTDARSATRTALNRMAMLSLVDPEQYGNLKVLAQAKGVNPQPLWGFTVG